MSDLSYIVAADLGQVADYTAIVVLERQEPWRGPVTYDVIHAERLPLGTPYTAIPDALRRIWGPLQQRWVDVQWEARGEGARLADAPIELIIDVTGVGRPVLDLLNASGVHPVAVTITAGRDATEPKVGEWHVPKRDLVSSVNTAMQSRRLRAASTLSEWPTLEAELRNFRARISLSGHDSYGAGPTDEWRMGSHDDLVLSLALAIWWGERMQNYELDPAILRAFADGGLPNSRW